MSLTDFLNQTNEADFEIQIPDTKAENDSIKTNSFKTKYGSQQGSSWQLRTDGKALQYAAEATFSAITFVFIRYEKALPFQGSKCVH